MKTHSISSVLAPKSDWDNAYRNTRPYAISRKDQIADWLLGHLPVGDGRRCLEIGCYPGRFLPLIGSLGYQLNGIDFHAGVKEMKQWLDAQGLRTGAFIEGDFFRFQAEEEFDLVISLGFVEHFEDWREVLHKHAELVKPGGYLIIEAPNFLGAFQQWFHRTFDADNLARHHLPAMDPMQWAQVLAAEGFDIEYAGYFGRFHLWTAQEGQGWIKRRLLKMFLRLRHLLKHLIPVGTRSFSPYAGLVAQRVVPPADR